MTTLRFENKEIEFTSAECAYRDIYNMYIDCANKSVKEYIEKVGDDIFKIESKESTQARLAQLDLTAKECIDRVVQQTIIEGLISRGYYENDMAWIKEHYDIYREWKNGIEKYYAVVENATTQYEVEREYRDMRKKARGRWVGGGFSVKGAIKGSVEAGAMNAVTGAAHSLANMIGNGFSENSMHKKIQAVWDEDVKAATQKALWVNIISLTDVWAEILNTIGVDIKIYTSEDMRRIGAILNNYDKIPNKEQKIEAIIQCIKIYPYNIGPYLRYLADYYDKDRDFDLLVKYLGIDIVMLKKMVMEMVLEGDYDSDVEYYNGLLMYQKTVSRFEMTYPELEKECVYVKDLWIEYGSGKNSYGEAHKIFLNTKFPISNGAELVRGNLNKAISVMKAKIDIAKIYEECQIQNKTQLGNAIEAIQNITNKEGVGKDVLKHLFFVQKCGQCILDVFYDSECKCRDSEHIVFPYNKIGINLRIIRNGMEEALVPYVGSGNVLSEEKKLAEEIIPRLKKKYDATDFQDLQSVKELTNVVERMYESLGVGKQLLQSLSKKIDSLEKRDRTVCKVEYATKQEADEARKTVVNGVQYDSIEKAALAQDELQKIEKIMKAQYSDEDIEGLIQAYKVLKQQKFQFESSHRKLEEIEKEIKREYMSLNKTDSRISDFKKTRNRFLIILLVSLVVGKSALLKINLLWIVIAVFCFIGSLKKVYEYQKSIMDLSHKREQRKMKLDALITVENGKLVLK